MRMHVKSGERRNEGRVLQNRSHPPQATAASFASNIYIYTIATFGVCLRQYIDKSQWHGRLPLNPIVIVTMSDNTDTVYILVSSIHESHQLPGVMAQNFNCANGYIIYPFHIHLFECLINKEVLKICKLFCKIISIVSGQSHMMSTFTSFLSIVVYWQHGS